MKQSRIMITGAAGFLGARAIQHFPGAISVPGELVRRQCPFELPGCTICLYMGERMERIMRTGETSFSIFSGQYYEEKRCTFRLRNIGGLRMYVR